MTPSRPPRKSSQTPIAATRRRWPDLSAEEQERVKRLLTPDPDDNLDDLLARMHRAQEIIEGTKP